MATSIPDGESAPAAEPMPGQVRPMLATPSATLPRALDRYAFEFKWDGIRAISFVRDGSLRVHSRNLIDITGRYPELQPLGRALGGQPAILDGEIVAFGADGRPSFQALQGRINIERESDVRMRLVETPVTYFIFDVLYLGEHSTMGIPYSGRRELLEALELDGPQWKTPPSKPGEGHETFEASKQLVLEGVVAKRLDGTYQPGVRSAAWLKIKNHLSQEFVVCGWTSGSGARSGTIGALLVGYYDRRPGEGTQRLVFAGRVGTGFTDRLLAELSVQLEALKRKPSPFANEGPIANATFVEPRLVCEVEFTEWTRDGTLRHPSFKGMRDDKNPRDIVRESPLPR
jgi:bifunctional non-homologous end joining protein LigD